MEQGGLLSLPAEVLQFIGTFLSVEDILACSATCHYLRNVLNSNIVWKRYLPESFTLDVQSFELCVEPAFCLEESLTPLCEKRVLVMTKMNLLNNWRNANFTRQTCEQQKYRELGRVSKVKGQAIYKDCYLFLGRLSNSLESGAVEVWDISKIPTLLFDLKFNETYYEDIYILGDKLVIVECIQVKVYRIEIPDKSLPLLFSFIVTENDAVFGKPVNHPWRHNFGCIDWNFAMVEHYLFASKRDCSETLPNVFHVWDLTNASKVGSFHTPISGFSTVYHSHVGSIWLLWTTKILSMESQFLQFDIQRKSFSEIVLKVNKDIRHSIVYNSYLICFEATEYDLEGWSDTNCSVYDFNSSEKLNERKFNNARRNYKISSTEVTNGQFIMLCIDGFHVIHAFTLELLILVPCRGLCCITHQLNIHGSIFILAATKQNSLELWDLSKKGKIREIKEGSNDHLYLNESCTKLVCVSCYELAVYHFL